MGGLEVASVDANGMFGSFLLLGTARSPWEATVVHGGDALRMSAGAAHLHAGRDPAFERALHIQSLLLIHSLSLTATCRAHHSVAQRLARWLLSAHDAAPTEEFAVTHDLLACVLGVQRPSVTISAGALQRTGAVEFRRGRVRVLDRAALRHQACRCYEDLATHRERLFARA
jgi:CRP-like cAMP-binding protein